MTLTLHNDRLGRRIAGLPAVLALVTLAGCSSPAVLPPNPVLENSQAHLDIVEKRLGSKPAPGPTHADYLELGVARWRVWDIYLARSRFPAGTGKARRQAAWNRRQAERLQPDVINAFQRAAEKSADPPVAASAKRWLSRVYGRIPDCDKQIAMLKRILNEHSDLNAPSVFGLGRTPHYYCYYTLAGVYRQRKETANAIDALARALVAIDAVRHAGATVGDTPTLVLGMLMDYEPRVVLPSYQRLLPQGAEKILRRHRTTAPTRIKLLVRHAHRDEVVVRYQVVYPAYPSIIKAWEQESKKPRPYLPDDYSRLKPVFHLSFSGLPVGDGFEARDQGPAGLIPRQFTPVLVFDKNATATGEMRLKWSRNAPEARDMYLTAKLVHTPPPGGRIERMPPLKEGVYVQPVRVTVEAPRDKEAEKVTRVYDPSRPTILKGPNQYAINIEKTDGGYLWGVPVPETH